MQGETLKQALREEKGEESGNNNHERLLCLKGLPTEKRVKEKDPVLFYLAAF